MMNTVAGLPVPPFADSAEFSDFINAVYTAVDKNYLSASHVLKCDPMTVWRIVNGKQHDSPKVRKQWGINPPTAPAPICTNPACEGYGQPHTYNCQTEQVKPIESKPSINRKPPRTWPSYFKGSQTDIEQVARQLEKYWPDYEIIKKEK